MNLCPKFNSKLIIENVVRDYIIRCSKCNYEITTTNLNLIDFDGTIYEVFIKSENNQIIDNIKFISKTMGVNFIEAKKILIQGGMYFKGYAIEILQKRDLLELNKIKYKIIHDLHY